MKSIIYALIIILIFNLNLLKSNDNKSELKYNLILKKANIEKWDTLPINEIIIKVGLEFLGTPYVGGTLEGVPETCKYDLSGLDCVTFYENSLAIARVIKKGELSLQDFEKELTFLRYRNGYIIDYASRLHYTTDYFQNNVQKGIWTDVTQKISGEKFEKIINFMSTNTQYYDALKYDSVMKDKIVDIENYLNNMERFFVPKNKVANIENFIKTGDIIGITSSVKGLDYNHTGIAFRDEKGVLRFLHASSTENKVIIDLRLSDYLQNTKKHTGISVVRPNDIK